MIANYLTLSFPICQFPFFVFSENLFPPMPGAAIEKPGQAFACPGLD
jgi:hypothetical protein